MSDKDRTEHDHKSEEECSPPPRRRVLSLTEATSVSAFESTVTETFVHNVTRAVKSMLEENSTCIGCRVSYNMQVLWRCLESDIDWLTLMERHDQTTNLGRTTPLRLILRVLTDDPTIFPIACYHKLLHVFWTKILEYCRKPAMVAFRVEADFLTRAQRMLWDVFLRKVRTYPALQTEMRLVQVESQHTSTLRQCQVSLKLLREIRQQRLWSEHFLLDVALRLLRQSEPYFASDSKPAPMPKRLTRRTVKANIFEVSHHDGEYESAEEDQRRLFPQMSSVKEPKMSLSRLLQQKPESNTVAIGFDRWESWRISVFDFALSCMTQTKHDLRRVIDQIWCLILEDVDQSSLLRFFLVSVMVSKATLQQDWCLSLFRHAISVSNDWNGHSAFALRCYSELVVELSAFDDLALLRKVTTPFFRHLLDKETCTHDLAIWKRALVFILSRRGTGLNTMPRFGEFKAEISMLWSCPDDWVNSSMSRDEQCHVIIILHQAGILGVCDVMEYSVDGLKVPALGPFKNWPFAKRSGIRAASPRCGKVNFSRHLFSAQESGSPTQRARSDPKQIEDIVKHSFHGDILLRIFSYMSFKRTPDLRQVCRDWKEVADHPRLWRSFYQLRYGFIEEDPVSNDPNQDWRTHFHHRMILERELRCQAVQGTRKLLVCQFVGCHKTVSSSHQLKHHHEKHQQKMRKQASAASLKKGSPRKRKRAPGNVRQTKSPLPQGKEKKQQQGVVNNGFCLRD